MQQLLVTSLLLISYITCIKASWYDQGSIGISTTTMVNNHKTQANDPQYTGVSFDNNNINAIPSGFLYGPNIASIDYGYNSITSDGLADDFLQLLPAIASVTLNYNYLTTVKATWFENKTAITHIYLCCQYGSKLSIIERRAFKDLVNLRTIYLHENNIRDLPFSMFDPNKLPTDLDFYIRTNPLNCTCSVCWIKYGQYLPPHWIEVQPGRVLSGQFC